MATRIGKKFDELRAKKEKALVVYLTAGDPSREMTKKIIFALEKAGVDIVEIGVPFSDPTADGPVIQEAAQRALKAGTTLTGVLQTVAQIREVSQIPVVLFGYFNPIFSYGVKKFAQNAREAGVDGVLVVDLPTEEAHELRQFTEASGIDFISLVAPTTGMQRAKKIAAAATGFLYYISITGVTGTAAPKIVDIEADLKKIRKISSLPVAVGFGISKPEQAREIGKLADGVVVGSALVKLIAENSNNAGLLKIISDYAGKIKNALKSA
ncbi:MAG TPA: tryptophan synthase subunit alpha [Deltaproteobacteria bacterium]|nr:tryptophan synthase subunit alpha [Deltaproteobacteria bacterium]